MEINKDNWLTLEDGTKMNYVQAGTGRPILMIHGWTGNSSSYEMFAEPLVHAGYRFIAPNMRGSKPTEHSKYVPATIMQNADDIHYFIQQLGLKDVVLAGHSQGGQNIMMYLSKYGCDNLHSVVLIDTTPANHQAPGFIKEYDDYTVATGYKECGMIAEDLVGYFSGFFRSAFPDASEEELRAFAEKNLEGQWLDETLTLYASAIILDARNFVDKMTVPLGYFYAKEGVLIRPQVNEWFAERIKDYTSYPFPTSSHGFFTEPEHIGSFTEKLLEFLKK